MSLYLTKMNTMVQPMISLNQVYSSTLHQTYESDKHKSDAHIPSHNNCPNPKPRRRSAVALCYRQQSQLWSAEIACAFGIDIGISIQESGLKIQSSSNNSGVSSASSSGNVQTPMRCSENTQESDFVKSSDRIHLATSETATSGTAYSGINAIDVSMVASTLPPIIASPSITDVIDNSPLVRALMMNHNSR
jgi:hypothetical protein